jgi:predicted nucleic acid-binding protein
MVVVVDTGALLALLNRADVWHTTVKEEFDATRRAWVIPWVVLAELDCQPSPARGAER